VDAGELTPGDGVPTLEVGSVPGTDPVAAARDALRLHPFLPSVPEMPAKSPLEGAVARGLEGFPFALEPAPGADARRFAVALAAHDPALPRAVEAARPGVPSLARAAGLHAFRRAVEERPAARAKAALLGPVALSRALSDPGGRPLVEVPRVLAAVAAFVVRRALAVARFLREAGAEPWIQLDEPGETDRPSDAALAILGDVLAALRGEGVRVAVHDCGAREGSGLAALAPHLALVDATRDPVPFLAREGALGDLLRGGTRIAWGVVPADGRPGPAGRGLAVLARAADAAGDARLVREGSALSPACGLGAVSGAEAAVARAALAAEAALARDFA
jgi:hypothetical protein